MSMGAKLNDYTMNVVTMQAKLSTDPQLAGRRHTLEKRMDERGLRV